MTVALAVLHSVALAVLHFSISSHHQLTFATGNRNLFWPVHFFWRLQCVFVKEINGVVPTLYGTCFFLFLGHLPFSCVSIIVFVLWNAKVFLRKVFSSYRVPKKWFLLICVPLFSDLTFVWSNIFSCCSTKQNFPQILKRRRRRREVVSDLGLTLTEVRWVFYMLHYCYIMFYINGTAVSPNMQETNQATPHKWLRQKPENKLFFNKVKALYNIESILKKMATYTIQT